MAPVKCDLKGVAEEWDQLPAVRDKVREGHPLMEPPEKEGASCTVKLATRNSEVMGPILVRMAASKCPDISPLRAEVEKFYKMNQREVPQDVAHGNSWELRSLATFIKRKTARKEPSLAVRLH